MKWQSFLKISLIYFEVIYEHTGFLERSIKTES